MVNAKATLGPTVRVPMNALNTYPGNARRGDVPLIQESLDENGQFAPLIVQKSTHYILSGNQTYAAAKQLGWADIDVAYVDVDDDRARKIVLAANRTADRGTYDLDALAALVSQVDDLTGTGFTPDDVAGLLHEQETQDAPEPRTTKTRIGVAVYCKNETEQLQLMTHLLEEGWDARAL